MTVLAPIVGHVSHSAWPCDQVDHLRVACAGAVHHNSMSPVMCQQCITAFRIIEGTHACGQLGPQKVADLKANANFFRSECVKVRRVNANFFCCCQWSKG